MKLSFGLFALAAGQNNVLSDEVVCGNCEDQISAFNNWLSGFNNQEVVCDRYVDPKELLSVRGACKECKIQCKPTQQKCEAVADLESGFWNRTAKKMNLQYIERAENMIAQDGLQRSNNQFAKEQAKFEQAKQKAIEKEAKAANKAAKAADWSQWRADKKQSNADARAARKIVKQEQKRLNKEAKALRQAQRIEKREFALRNKVLFAFYADIEEHYESVCPDLFLIAESG